MLDKVFTNNQVTIAGEVVSEFTFSHEVYGEHFYIVNIAVCRLSNSYDVIPVMVSERLIDVTSDYRGCVLQFSDLAFCFFGYFYPTDWIRFIFPILYLLD